MTTYKYFFHNFTDKPFTGYWNGKPYTFKPGVKKDYKRLIARHFAKHLTNQVLTESGEERMTSPKKPDEVPAFMNIFRKAFLVEEVADEDNLDIDSDNQLTDEPSMNIKTGPRTPVDAYDASANPMTGPEGAPQTLKVEAPTEEGKEDSNEEDDYQNPDQNKK